MRLAIQVLIALAGCLVGCSSLGGPTDIGPACQYDEAICGEGQICFPEGCGDPGENLVVEITVNNSAGHHAQDVRIDELVLPLGLEASPPMSLAGEILRLSGPESSTPPPTKEPYTGSVIVRALGESQLIPGLIRRYEATVSNSRQGTYSMPIGAGLYTVAATPTDRAVPILTVSSVSVEAAQQQTSLPLTFPATSSLQVLTGRLLKTVVPGPPAIESPITEAVVELQAFDPQTRRPLSQRALVSSGVSGSKGDFVLSLNPAVDKLDSIWLVATARDVNSPVPSKTFTLTRPFVQPLSLELGDFGKLLPKVTGTVQNSTQQPVKGARVVLEGVVGGGGTFRSASVLTNDLGVFEVDLLPSAGGAAYTVTVVPPGPHVSGILVTRARAVVAANGRGALVPEPKTQSEPVFECPDKVAVIGSVVRWDSTAAIGVKVIAQAISALPGRPLPSEPVETFTDDNGRFSLNVDPASYRFDFIPGEGNPRRSRTEVEVPVNTLSSAPVVDLNEFRLYRGRTVTGTVGVRSPLVSTGINAASNATLRFFRVTSVGGKRSSVLLGEALSDTRGNYSVVLPSP